MADATFLRLLAWTSPSFPIGAFAYSHGLETAVELGEVRDRDALVAYVAAALLHGAGHNDAILAAHGWRDGVDDALLALACSLRATSELATEQAAQGSAALRTLRAAWPHPALDDLASRAATMQLEPPLSLVLATAARAHGLALDQLLAAMLHAFAASLVSAGVRLVPLGQTDGQRAIVALEPVVLQVAAASASADLDELGGCAVRIDLLAALHETQRTRLFRS